MAALPIIHVGFAHSGTTSLQENIFSKRSDIFYAARPYGGLGGIFSRIKCQEPQLYDADATARGCEALIFDKMRANQDDRRIVISDETLVDQPAIYYTPAMMPVALVAERLRALFGEALILFTIRNQLRSVISNYLVLKANYAALANRTIEPFDAWFAGNLGQVRNLFLRNLDLSLAIKAYQTMFGAHAVQVLPLELLLREGTAAYLGRLSQITGLEISHADVAGYVARNASPPHDIVLTSEQCDIIHRRSAAGNVFVAEHFGLPLRDFGYPWPA
jgi:hypothetical protein